MESASSDVNGSSDVHLLKKQHTEDKTRSAMLNFDVLDCPICYEPLTIPIFQCDNGHLACSSCCPRLRNKCPTCTFPIGNNRCRAMESVLESVFVPCPNAKLGCTKKVSYGKESTHGKECMFSQCSCPALDCNYIGSFKDLYYHYNYAIHKITYISTRFRCGKFFNVRMNVSDKILIKKEYTKRLLFAVQCFKESYGVYITVSCIAPSAPEVGQCSYHLSYTVDGHAVIYKSLEVKKVLEVSFQTPRNNFMLIPNRLLRGELLEMKFCIS